MKIALRVIDRIFLAALAVLVAVTGTLILLFNQQLETHRSPMVAYLGDPLNAPEIWITTLDGERNRQLTQTSGRVVDFFVSPDGELIIYCVKNDSGGSDLYRIDRNGENNTNLVTCGEGRCEQVAWSADGKTIAYSHISSTNSGNNSIQFTDAKDGTPQEIAGGTINGAFPVISPDGKWLAYYGSSDHSIHIRNLESGSEVQVASKVASTSVWSASSDILFFIDEVTGDLFPQTRLFQFHLGTSRVEPFLADQTAGYDAALPEWSSDGEWVAFGLKSIASQAGRQIYIVRSDGTDMLAITSEESAAHSAYHWSPDGQQLVFQRYVIGDSTAAPQIFLWDYASGRITLLVENGALPAWLP